jgi:hypothetical protein
MTVQTKKITTKSKSIIKILKEQNLLNDQLLVSLNSLSLEDLIAVKLELAANNINNRLYGFDIWRALPNIVQEATLKFAISTTKSKKDASRFLGLTYLEFLNICKKYQINKFFDTDKEEKQNV